ncbi:MAG: class II fructose-bisphosphate aldolase [Christensenellaceae bacterium]
MLVNLDGILKRAQREKYAVGLFNTTDTDMLQAAVEAAEELASPIVIGTAEILLPYGGLKLIAPSVVEAAKRAKVPVAVHYDHGLTFERCMEALKLGFSSVMYDGSAKKRETNIAETREIVKIAHSFGATVEGGSDMWGRRGGRKSFRCPLHDARRGKRISRRDGRGRPGGVRRHGARRL